MRIAIKLQPLAYPAAIPVTHHQLQAFIYEMVGAVNPGLSQAIHDIGWPASADPMAAKRFKFFVFSVPEAPRGFVFRGDEKVFDSGTVFWQISSLSSEFMTSLVAGLAVNRVVRIGRTDFAVEDVQFVQPPEFSSEMRFIALSPLVASKPVRAADGRTQKIYLRDEAEFSAAIVENLKTKYRAAYGQSLDGKEVAFVFDQHYLQNAGGFDSRKVTRVIYFAKRMQNGAVERIGIRGIQAPFVVRGSRELIEMGWETGFGEANSQGFGMAGLG